jgi:hypothetical protein
MTYKTKFADAGEFIPSNLIAGNAHLLLSQKITLAAGQNLTAGAVLGKITAGGKYVLSTSAAVDGSEAPDLILAEDCDASAGDREELAYSRGDFGDLALTVGAGHTVASITDALRSKGITIINVTP